LPGWMVGSAHPTFF